MKISLFKIMLFTGFLGLFGCRSSDDPSEWRIKEINKWFEKGRWLNSWQAEPDVSVNRKEFAVSYFTHKERWDKAFAFLRENDLTKLELRRYDIDGNDLYAVVSEYLTKNEEDARYEAHRQYIDIQYVISGKELIGIAHASDIKEILEPYDFNKDIVFMTVNLINNSPANPDRFFIFFPDDIHRPGLKDGENSIVRKIVVKVNFD
jgi:YhcH/YjgK/YiaL family protein